MFFRLTADAVILAYKRLAPAEAKYGESSAEGISFCRNYHLSNGRVITFPPKDGSKIIYRLEHSTYKHSIFVHNSNSYCGYIPTKELLLKKEKNQLYETSLCFGSCHVPETGDFVTEKILEIANKLKED